MKTLLISILMVASSAFAHPQHEAEHKLMRETAEASPTPIAVFTGKIPAGNAQAYVNLKDNRCEITLGTERAAPHLSKFYEAALWPKFFALHETAHCILYSQQGQLAGKNVLSDGEQRLLQDFMALHFLKFDEEVHGGVVDNFNVTYHEMFADSLAILVLLRDGASSSDLAFIRAMRQATAFTSSHDTTKAIDRLFMMVSKQRPVEMNEMIALAKQVAVVSAFERLALSKPTGDGNAFLVGPQMVSLLKNVYNQSVRGPLHTHDYMIVDYSALSNLDNYSAIKHSLVISKEVAKYSEREFLEVWIKEQYGLTFAEWQVEIQALSIRLEQLSMK